MISPYENRSSGYPSHCNFSTVRHRLQMDLLPRAFAPFVVELFIARDLLWSPTPVIIGPVPPDLQDQELPTEAALDGQKMLPHPHSPNPAGQDLHLL